MMTDKHMTSLQSRLYDYWKAYAGYINVDPFSDLMSTGKRSQRRFNRFTRLFNDTHERLNGNIMNEIMSTTNDDSLNDFIMFMDSLKSIASDNMRLFMRIIGLTIRTALYSNKAEWLHEIGIVKTMTIWTLNPTYDIRENVSIMKSLKINMDDLKSLIMNTGIIMNNGTRIPIFNINTLIDFMQHYHFSQLNELGYYLLFRAKTLEDAKLVAQGIMHDGYAVSDEMMPVIRSDDIMNSLNSYPMGIIMRVMEINPSYDDYMKALNVMHGYADLQAYGYNDRNSFSCSQPDPAFCLFTSFLSIHDYGAAAAFLKILWYIISIPEFNRGKALDDMILGLNDYGIIRYKPSDLFPLIETGLIESIIDGMPDEFILESLKALIPDIKQKNTGTDYYEFGVPVF